MQASWKPAPRTCERRYSSLQSPREGADLQKIRPSRYLPSRPTLIPMQVPESSPRRRPSTPRNMTSSRLPLLALVLTLASHALAFAPSALPQLHHRRTLACNPTAQMAPPGSTRRLGSALRPRTGVAAPRARREGAGRRLVESEGAEGAGGEQQVRASPAPSLMSRFGPTG